MPKIQLRNALICDKVYQDDFELACVNRVYPGRLVIDSVPSVFELFVFCTFAVETDVPMRLEFKLAGPRVTAGGAGILDNSSDYFEIIAPFFTYLDGPAELSFRWRVDDGKWSKPIRWGVEISDDAVYLDDSNVQIMRALFNARGSATRLIDRAIVRSIATPKTRRPVAEEIAE